MKSAASQVVFFGICSENCNERVLVLCGELLRELDVKADVEIATRDQT